MPDMHVSQPPCVHTIEHVDAALKALQEAKGAAAAAEKDKRRKPPREMDFSRFATRKIALQIAYDGDKYAGFASQVGTPGSGLVGGGGAVQL
jgi:hypothetical protein